MRFSVQLDPINDIYTDIKQTILYTLTNIINIKARVTKIIEQTLLLPSITSN